ncbi:MAG: beta strand repeat-containing protein [Deltaproteobacteria bacterium]
MTTKWNNWFVVMTLSATFMGAGACSCGTPVKPGGTSGASTSGGTTGGGTTGGGTTGGGTTGGNRTTAGDGGSDAGEDAGRDAGPSCKNDPGCVGDGGTVCAELDGGAAGVGTCERGTDGCFHVAGVKACPSTLQTCPIDGGTACECPATPGCTLGSSACADGGVATCALDVTGGCPVIDFAACQSDQLCGSVDGGTAGALAACECNNQCSGSNACIDTTHTATCTADTNGCLILGTATACASPKTCQPGASPADTCACPPVSNTVTPGNGCQTAGATACDSTGNIDTCTATNGCNLWAATTTCSGGYTCIGTGTLSCGCPDNGTNATVYVDPVNGNDGTFSNGSVTETPTGVQTPAACRFKTLAHSFGVVASGGKVIATGFSSSQVQFTQPNETFPITVPANVTLTTSDSPLTTTNYAIVFNNGTAANAVLLSSGSTLSGFAVTDNGGNAAASMIACSSGSVTLDTDVVNGLNNVTGGGAPMATGVADDGTCSLTATGVTVENFGIEGVALNATTDAGTPSITTTNGAVGPNDTDGLRVNAGTATLTGTHFDGNGVTNNVSSGVTVETGTLTATSITASNNKGSGIFIDAATTSASVTGATASGNGYDGLLLRSNSTLATVTANGNGHDGLEIAAGTVTDTSGVYGATGAGNAVDGIALTETATPLSFTGNGTSASGNAGNGINLIAGNGAVAATVGLHGVTLSGNGARGLHLGPNLAVSATASANTTVTVDGTGGATTIDKNGTGTTKASGVRVESGTLGMTGAAAAPVTVSGSGLAGVRITYGSNTIDQTTTLSDVTVGGTVATAANGVGVDINSGGSPITIEGCAIEGNTGDGLAIEQSPAANGGADSVQIGDLTVGSTTSHTSVASNGANGVDVSGSAGNVTVVLQNANVDLNHNAGVLLSQATGGGGNARVTKATLSGNTISQNNVAAVAQSGGVVITGPITLAGFTGNTVAKNQGDQVDIASAPPASATTNCVGLATPCWNLAAGSCGSTNNTFSCYVQAGTVGLRANSGTGTPVNVNAGNNAWKNDPPISGTDYAVTGVAGGTIDVANPCAAPTSCP